MKYIIETRNMWELGLRDNQEDSLFPVYNKLTEKDRLFILCDGMGGHASGEVASSTVCEAMSQSILNSCPDSEGEFTDDILRQAISDAYDTLDNRDTAEEGKKKMGTTMTFLKLHNQGCTIAHIGDSRVYHIRPGKDVAETQILHQTVDHSLVNDLIKAGEITPEEAKTSRVRNVITRAMQPHMEYRCRPEIYHTQDIKPGDYFMLCSDGVLEQLEDEHIKFYFSEEAGDINKKIEKLTLATQHNSDNHTAILIHIVDVIDPIALLPDNSGNDDCIPHVTVNDVNKAMENEIILDEEGNTVPPGNDNDKGNSNNDTKRPQPHLPVKQILLACALLVVIIALFLLLRSCNSKANREVVSQRDSVTVVTPATQEEINKNREKASHEAEKRILEAEKKVLEAEKRALEAEKKVVEAEKKAVQDAIKATQAAEATASQESVKEIVREVINEQVAPTDSVKGKESDTQTEIILNKVKEATQPLSQPEPQSQPANHEPPAEDTPQQGGGNA